MIIPFKFKWISITYMNSKGWKSFAFKRTNLPGEKSESKIFCKYEHINSVPLLANQINMQKRSFTDKNNSPLIVYS